MKKYLILLLLLIPSLSWGVCTYTAGNISCVMDAITEDGTATSTVYVDQADAYLNYTGDSRGYYGRWKVSIPKATEAHPITITNAVVNFTAHTTTTAAATTNVGLIDDIDCDPFSGATAWNLPILGDPVAWVIPSTTAGSAIDTTALNIASLVQAWVGMAGHDYNQYIGLRFRYASGGTRQIKQANGANATAVWPVLNITFTGGEPYIDVKMAAPYVRTTQNIYVYLYNLAAGDKLVVTLDGEATGLTYTSAATVGDNIVVADYTGLTAGSHTLRFSVTDSADDEYATTVYTYTWTTTHSGIPLVGINKDNALCFKNGSACDTYFPITDFMLDKSKLTTGDVVPGTNSSWAVGYNTNELSSRTLLGFKAMLDAWQAADRKMFGPVAWDGYTHAGDMDLAKMATNATNCGDGDGKGAATSASECSYVNFFKNHPAMGAWSWSDDPHVSEHPENWPTVIRPLDTNHPIALLQPGLITTWTYSKFNKADVSDIWYTYEYPYGFRHPTANTTVTLETSVASIDATFTNNYALFPVWFMTEDRALGDLVGNITAVWAENSAAHYQNRQIIMNSRVYRQTETSCISGATAPSWPSTIGDTVADNTCTWIDEGTKANKVININGATWSETSFQAGERVCATTGGCGTASAFLGRPRTDGTFAQTDATIIRKPAGMDGYSYNQLVFSSVDGTFTTGMSITGQTSGATATTDASDLWYREAEAPVATAKYWNWPAPPEPVQMENMIWLGIIHGARGVGYFPYWQTNKPTLRAAITAKQVAIKNTINTLKDVLLAPISSKLTPAAQYKQFATASSTGSARVDYTIKEYGGQTWLIAARLKTNAEGWPNPSNTDAETATFTVGGLAASTSISPYPTGDAIVSGNGTFSDTFNDYDVKIYLVGEAVSSYALTVAKAGDGSGTVTSSPAGINCGTDCTETYASGTSVTLTASVVGNNALGAWSGGGCSGNGATCTVSVTEATEVTKSFTDTTPRNFNVTISYAGTGVGTTSPAAGVTAYANGATATTTQTPTNSTFTGWSGTCGCTGTGACAPTISADCTIIATWADATLYGLTVEYSDDLLITSAAGGITCGSENQYCYNEYYSGDVVLTGTCKDGYYGLTWSGDGTGTTTRTVTMDGNKSVSASCINGRSATISPTGGAGTMTLGAGGSGVPSQCNIESDTVGTNDISGSSPSRAKDSVWCYLHTPTCYGSLATAYVRHSDTNESSAKVCVYSDDGDSVANSGDLKIGCSSDITSSLIEWKSSAMDGGSLTEGNYWVCTAVKSDATNVFTVDRGSTTRPLAYKTASGFYATPPANLNGLTTTSSAEHSVYITVGP